MEEIFYKYCQNFAKNIKIERLARKMTQKQVAESIGIKTQSYQAYENNVALPNVINLLQLAELFNVSIDYLLSDTNTIETMPNNSSKLLKDELALLRLYRSLSERSKKELLSQGHLLTLRDREDRIIRKR